MTLRDQPSAGLKKPVRWQSSTPLGGAAWFDYRLPQGERRRGCTSSKTCLIVFNLFLLFPHLLKIVAFNNGTEYGWRISHHSKDFKSSLPEVDILKTMHQKDNEVAHQCLPFIFEIPDQTFGENH